jgi:hypothetical protein
LFQARVEARLLFSPRSSGSSTFQRAFIFWDTSERPAAVADFDAHRGEFFAAVKAEYPVSRALLVDCDPALAEPLTGTFGNEAEVNLSHSPRTAHVQDSYSSPSLLPVFNDLFVAVLLFDFVPESRDLAAAVPQMLDNVMEGDNPACADER